METRENGFANSAARFQQVVSFCAGYGSLYSPSAAEISLAALQAKHAALNTELSQTIVLKTAYENAVDNRRAAFKKLSAIPSRIVNSMIASKCSPEHIERVKTIKRKMVSGTKKDSGNPEPPSPEGNPEERKFSRAQRGFDSQLEHLSGIMEVLALDPNFHPAIPEIQVAQLQQFYQELQMLNANVQEKFTALSNARIRRNELLFNSETGVRNIVRNVKAYVKSVFGSSSPQFKQLARLQFRGK